MYYNKLTCILIFNESIALAINALSLFFPILFVSTVNCCNLFECIIIEVILSEEQEEFSLNDIW